MSVNTFMHRSGRCLLCWLLIVAWGRTARGADFEAYLTGNAADVRPTQTAGALLLMGGGGLVDAALRWFVARAGGGDIVVLKASNTGAAVPDTYGAYLHDTIGGCDSVEVIVFNNRNAATAPQVLRALQNADGIFLAGGKQFLYADYWKDTPVAAALEAHVRAGRPLGGSSAGLAVLGQFCYTAHLTARLTSAIAMQNPYDKRVTLESDFLHFDLLRGAITDSHFSPRDRLGRLITFVARTSAENPGAPLLGIGVDERTALCLEADGKGRVWTSAPAGRVWLIMPQQAPEVLADGVPLTVRDVKVAGAGPDSTVNIHQRTVEKPASVRNVSVVRGALSSQPE